MSLHVSTGFDDGGALSGDYNCQHPVRTAEILTKPGLGRTLYSTVTPDITLGTTSIPGVRVAALKEVVQSKNGTNAWIGVW
jgi:hypothetical protein